MSTVNPPRKTVEALLADGTTVELRPLGPEDHRAVLDLHAVGMSEESRRMRFFGASRNAPRQAADRLCGLSRSGLLVLGAWAGDELVGEADCERLDDPPETAELALAVADRWQHRGVATLLLEHLVHAARGAGIRFFEADTLAGNHAVRTVFADLGLPVERRYAQGSGGNWPERWSSRWPRRGSNCSRAWSRTRSSARSSSSAWAAPPPTSWPTGWSGSPR